MVSPCTYERSSWEVDLNKTKVPLIASGMFHALHQQDEQNFDRGNLSFSVDDGAIMDVQFTNFYHRPSGFDEIMIEKSLL